MKDELWDWADVAAVGVVSECCGLPVRTIARWVDCGAEASWVIQIYAAAAGIRYGAREEKRRRKLRRARAMARRQVLELSKPYPTRMLFNVDQGHPPRLGGDVFNVPGDDKLVSAMKRHGSVRVGTAAIWQGDVQGRLEGLWVDVALVKVER